MEIKCGWVIPAIVLASVQSYAEYGRIEGKIVDSENGEPLP